MTTRIFNTRPLAGRHALVTGASRGIGLAIADTLTAMGADVTLNGRNAALLAEGAAALAKHGTRIAVEAFDVADPIAVEQGFAAARGRLGPIAILVNNAGIAQAAPFQRTTLAMWQQIMAVDLTGVFICCQQVFAEMATMDYARIINIASVAGLTGLPYAVAYTSAKHGLIGLTRGLAAELAKTKATVNAVCPGYVDTDIVRDAIANIVAKTKRTPEQALAEIVANNPQGRLITVEEVADAVGWLCLDSAASVNGQAITLDGGRVM